MPEPTVNAQESLVRVPGGELAYRLAGPPDAPVIVFETGWGASYVHGALLEQHLTDRFRVLSYDRAGVGRSTSTRPPTTSTLTEDLLALVDALGIASPVIVSGHSFGGLMVGLHAAQAPQAVRAALQLDPTPELPDAYITKMVRTASQLVAIVLSTQRLRRRLPLPPPRSRTWEELPVELAARMELDSGTRASLNASRRQLALLDDIRSVIGDAAYQGGMPRLIVRAGETAPVNGALARALGGERVGQRTLATVGRLLEEQASESGAKLVTVPTAHGGMMVTQAGAAATAEAMKRFLDDLDRGEPESQAVPSSDAASPNRERNSP